MQTKIEKITPELAKSILAKNTSNRKISKGNLKNIKSAMARGEWKFNGDPIRISKSGVLLDGQHRLTAISESSGAFECLVIYDLDDDVFTTIDIGKKRNGSDALYINGHKNVHTLSALCRMILSTRLYGNPYVSQTHASSNESISLTMIADFADSDDFVHESASFAQSSKKIVKMFQNSNIAYAHYVFMKDSPSLAIDFFEQLENGEYLYRNSPAKALREMFINFAIRGVKPTKQEKLAYLFKAYRAYKRQAQVKIVRLDKDTANWFKL